MADGFAVLVSLASNLMAVAAAAATIVGIALLLAPHTVLGLSKRLNRWSTPRKLLRNWELPRDSERFVYRHHRLFGAFLIAGASYTLFGLAAGLRPSVHQQLTTGQLATYMLDAVLIFLVLGSGMALVIGSIMLVRPSRLKRVESVANAWISTRRVLRAIDLMDDRIDNLVFRQPRLAGLVFLGTGIYLTAMRSLG